MAFESVFIIWIVQLNSAFIWIVHLNKHVLCCHVQHLFSLIRLKKPETRQLLWIKNLVRSLWINQENLHENSFLPKMSTKLILIVWSYHTVISKLLNCNSIAVFFLYFYLSRHEIYKSMVMTIKLLKYNNFQILWKTNIVFCVRKTTC